MPITRIHRAWLLPADLRRLGLVCAATAVLLVACAPSSVPASAPVFTPGPSFDPFPSQPADVPWPTTDWTVAELPPDVDAAALDAAVEEAFNDGGPERVRALLIVHRGALVYERYSPNPEDGREVIANSYSMSKSVLAAFIGILAHKNLIDVHAPAAIPEWHADPNDPRAAITVEHMLHMATGIPWIEDPSLPGSNLAQMGETPDRAAYAASLELKDPPGTVFGYSSGTSTVLARLFGGMVGANRDEIEAYMDRALFSRIGMVPVETEFDAAGTWLGGFSTHTTARGFARFGLLYLRGGAWDGEQIIPVEWVNYSRTPSPASAEYGAHWWLDPARPGVFMAWGAFGQVVAVDPARDLVVVQLAESLGWDGDRGLVFFVLDRFAEALQ